jgi:hypothetical protein
MGTDKSRLGPQNAYAVQEVIRCTERELQDLLRRRADVTKRIGTIKQMLTGLANIFGEAVLGDELLNLIDRKPLSRQSGLTRVCRAILMGSGKPLGARIVCQALQQKHPELIERHKDSIASVTTVLNRLKDYEEARCSLDANGRRVWEWIAQPEDCAGLRAESSKSTPGRPLSEEEISRAGE